ncbi:mannosyl transferase [Salegentibacter salinarum]|uniref:Mannosyl transferase n=1 Tax=Salegentibacter salinarum TaxID=447422 RepID=A0A2N0TYB9_9FLAO|nr:glycosyltransferase [Salegentibacter salinarum]PKD19676.1 mannosyl transferase [Salegentibacter salinarum]SKB90627.1 Glycosyltransferase involved in cell wall bisynthesis [Salegentibacter salinarum]
MNIVFFSHPSFIAHKSMPRFTRLLDEGMRERGHTTRVWSPRGRFYYLPMVEKFKKWLGYLDQYLLFPLEVYFKVKKESADTLFVFTDHALGPWVPLVFNRPHAIHCHDFLAQRAALDEISENITGWTGKKYQAMIRRGYSRGRNYISVSKNTKRDLHRFTSSTAGVSEVVYNGLNNSFKPMNVFKVRIDLKEKTGIDVCHGYILHVGGNQWYKNRRGVIEIYNAWRIKFKKDLPLLLVGEKPDELIRNEWQSSSFKKDIHMLDSFSDEWLKKVYAGASVFLFPSLAEGFGWPIAEAMASGCPVITTREAPMTEVAKKAALYVPRKPSSSLEVMKWSENAAEVLEKIISSSSTELEMIKERGIQNARRFNSKDALDKIEKIYLDILKSENN